jgi:hypothetical protein
MLWHAKMTLDWLPSSLRIELDSVEANLPGSKSIGYPDSMLQDVLEQTIVLQKLLVDCSNILMSFISVMEAGSIKE